MGNGFELMPYFYFLKRTFDKVPHQILLLKLTTHDLGNGMINGVENGLLVEDNKTGGFKVEIGVEWSTTWINVRTNFILNIYIYIYIYIYINDLDDGITSKVVKFADDTKVFRMIKSDGDRQQHWHEFRDMLIEWSKSGECYLSVGNGNVIYKVSHYVNHSSMRTLVFFFPSLDGFF